MGLKLGIKTEKSCLVRVNSHQWDEVEEIDTVRNALAAKSFLRMARRRTYKEG